MVSILVAMVSMEIRPGIYPSAHSTASRADLGVAPGARTGAARRRAWGGVIAAGGSSLAWLGRASILSGTASAELTLNARDIYLRRLRIFGVEGAESTRCDAGWTSSPTVRSAHRLASVSHSKRSRRPLSTCVRVNTRESPFSTWADRMHIGT